MVQAWFMDDSQEDQRAPHQLVPNQPVSLQKLRSLGIWYWRCEGGPSSVKLNQIRKERNYANHDFVEIAPGKLPNYEQKLKIFFEEHLHEDEEIRYVLDGTGYFDCRDDEDRWIRIAVKQWDLIVIPAGMYHRFTLDTNNYIHAMRLFQDEPKWLAYNRVDAETEDKVSRKVFLTSRIAAQEQLAQPRPNGKAVVLQAKVDDEKKAVVSAPHFPKVRSFNGSLYISGVTAQRQDGSWVGVDVDENGAVTVDAGLQLEGAMDHLNDVLLLAGASIDHLVDLTVFLTDRAHLHSYNTLFDAYFDEETAPTRTTAFVCSLSHPNQIVELRAIAAAPQ